MCVLSLWHPWWHVSICFGKSAQKSRTTDKTTTTTKPTTPPRNKAQQQRKPSLLHQPASTNLLQLTCFNTIQHSTLHNLKSSQITIHTQSKLLICTGDSNHRMAKSLNGEKENTIQKCILKIQNSIGYWLKEKDILHVCMVILMDLYPCFLMNSPRNCELWSNHKFRYIVCSLIWNYRDAFFSIDDQIFHVFWYNNEF